MTTVQDAGTWDVVETTAVGFASDLDARTPRVRIVFRHVGGQWVPWVLEAQSAGLRSVGVVGYGLYTLRPLQGARQTRFGTVPGSNIGRYGGSVLGTFDDLDSVEARRQIEAWAREGRDSMLAMRVRPGEGVSIVDGADGPPPLVYRINDARGIQGRSNNVRFTETGVAVATRRVPAADLTSTSLGAIATSELFVNYEAGSPGFWRIHRHLGRDAAHPITLESAFQKRCVFSLSTPSSRTRVKAFLAFPAAALSVLPRAVATVPEPRSHAGPQARLAAQ